MSIKGLEQAIANLESISKTAVKRASSQAVNRVAARAASKAISIVAKETRVPRKLVKQRVRIKNATAAKPKARIQVNRGNLPAIKLGVASVRMSRRKRDIKGVACCKSGLSAFLVLSFSGLRMVAGTCYAEPQRAVTL